MDNQNIQVKKEKSNKGIIVFLILIILGLAGYIAYDKVYPKLIKNDTKESVKKEKETDKDTLKSYKIGDRVEFNNTNWYVIANSDEKQDYVTLLKEKVLSIEELGTYAYLEYTDSSFIYYIKRDAMVYSNDNNTNFKDSLIYQFLNNSYSSSLADISDLTLSTLKEVDGYKVRLLHATEVNELRNYYWFSHDYVGYYADINGGIEVDSLSYSFWTMDALDEKAGIMNCYTGISCSGGCNDISANYQAGVRPVINVYKEYITKVD